MTNDTATVTPIFRAQTWWDTESTPVRTVLDVAAIEDDGARRRIAAVAYPTHEAAIDGIAAELAWIDRLEWDEPGVVLADLYDVEVHGPCLIDTAERAADAKRADVRMTAQLIASLTARGAA